jgi:hypothetical protein
MWEVEITIRDRRSVYEDYKIRFYPSSNPNYLSKRILYDILVRGWGLGLGLGLGLGVGVRIMC